VPEKSTLPELDEEDFLEAGIALEDFRMDSQRVIYETLLQWVYEAKASIAAVAEARQSLLDSCVYGDYRARRLTADFLGKTLESSTERLIGVIGQIDTPVQVKSALETRDSGEAKMNPITEALFKLDGQSRENLRTAFLTLLNEAYRLQSPEPPITVEATKTNAEGHGNSANVPASEVPAVPEAAAHERRTRRARRKGRPVRNKRARKVVLRHHREHSGDGTK
jgi:hypothetical protein